MFCLSRHVLRDSWRHHSQRSVGPILSICENSPHSTASCRFYRDVSYGCCCSSPSVSITLNTHEPHVWSLALIWYEYVLTFEDELRCMWDMRISPYAILYCVNRYGVLLASVVHILVKDPQAGLSERVRFDCVACRKVKLTVY